MRSSECTEETACGSLDTSQALGYTRASSCLVAGSGVSFIRNIAGGPSAMNVGKLQAT